MLLAKFRGSGGRGVRNAHEVAVVSSAVNCAQTSSSVLETVGGRRIATHQHQRKQFGAASLTREIRSSVRSAIVGCAIGFGYAMVRVNCSGTRR